VTVDASASSVCAITAGAVSFSAAGTCTLDANQSGNANYNPAPQVQQTFTVGKASQTVSFTSTAPTGATVNGPTYVVAATATSGLTVTFTIDGTSSSICSDSGDVVSFIGAGSCVIDANQAGNANYNAAPQVQQTVNVSATAPGAPTIGTATGGNSSATVTWTAPPANGSPITGYTVTTYLGGAAVGTTPAGTSVHSIVITGLTNGQSYTFTVTATNSVGTGPPSAHSNPVSPRQPGTTALTNLSVTPSNPYASLHTALAFKFTTSGSGSLHGGGTITVGAVLGSVLPSTASDYSISLSGAGSATVASVGTVPGVPNSTARITLGAGSAIGNLETVTVTVKGAINPHTGSATEIGIASTSSDTGFVDAYYAIYGPGYVNGYWLAASDGGVFAFGQTSFFGSTGSLTLNKPIEGMTATPDGKGYWLVASDGGVFAFGDAGFYGSTGSLTLNSPIVGMAATPDGKGYWLVAADGGLFAFGDAPFFGSLGATPLNKPIVAMTSTPDGQGYWMVASDGGIFAFGDASFFGSTGSLTLNKPIEGMSSTPDGQGYWLVASDGGVFAFGDAAFHGSTGALTLNKPIVGMATDANTSGYWLVAADGGMFSFDAPFYGSLGGLPLNKPIVALAN